MKNFCASLCCVVALCLPVMATEPEETSSVPRGGPPAKPFFIQLRYTPAMLFESELRDVEGELTTRRHDVTGTLTVPIPKRGRVNASVSRERFEYRFRRTSAEEAPFEDAYSTSANLAYMGRLTGPWTTFAMARVSWDAEKGASRSDGRTEGGLIQVQRRVGDDLELGFGVTASTRLNEDVSIIPIPSISWDINEQWRLRTMRGLHLLYAFDPDRHWELGMNVEYHSTYFRLNDTGPAPEGVFRQRLVASTLSLMYRPNPGVQIGGEIGYIPWREIRLSDRDKQTVYKTKVDPGFSAAFTAAMTF